MKCFICSKKVFALTLCKTHYKRRYVQCSVEGCSRPWYCHNACVYHYRKGIKPPKKQCALCPRQAFINGKCVRHIVSYDLKCMYCPLPSFCKNMCQMHYTRVYRARTRSSGNNVAVNSSATADEKSPPNPININQTPVSNI